MFKPMAFAAAVALCASFVTPVSAQQKWPTRPVKFLVPFAPGAGADIGARVAAELLQQKWGQAVVVENRPGGDSLVAIRAVVNDNDDHEFLFAPSGNFTPHPYKHEKLGYVRERDLLPIARFSNTILAVGVSESIGVTSIRELVDLAKKKPKELNVVTVPGITDMVWDNFTRTEGLDVTKVPYNNLVQGAGEMATGRIQITISALAIMQPVLGTKQARLLATTSAKRVSMLPDLPSVVEAGAPSLEYEGLTGLFGPRSVSPELRKRIGEDFVEIASQPIVAQRLAATGQVPNPGGSEAFAADIAAQEKQVETIARNLGMAKLN